MSRCRVALAAGLLSALASCGKPQPPAAEPKPAAPAAAPVAEPPVAPPAPLAAVPTAVAAPSAASATVAAPADATPALAPAASVAMFLDAGTGNPADMPTAGKPVKITVTPVDERGRAIADREPVLGAQIALVAVRYDVSWKAIIRAEKLSLPERNSHEFKLTFPKAGHHLLYFLFQPKGKPLATIPIDITVQGRAEPAVDWPEAQDRYDEGPVSVALKTDHGSISACDRVKVATIWTRKGNPQPLRANGDSKVFYLALAESLGTPAIGKPVASQTSAAPLGGDDGTEAALRLETRGHVKLLAIADVGSDKKPEIIAAWFGLTVKGPQPPEGCP